MTRFSTPGLRFVTDLPKPGAELPRMDIAGFVGLAASGPVGIPVPIEDEESFSEIFGGELPLAWDADAGRMQTAHLAGSVRAFFRGGGQRCWVVRVAGESASTQRFPLLGMVARKKGPYRSATLSARCFGSWADQLQVETRLRSLAVRILNRDKNTLEVADLGDWRNGDLIRLNYADGVADYLNVVAVSTPTNEAGSRLLKVKSVQCVQALSEIPAVAGYFRVEKANGRFSIRSFTHEKCVLSINLSNVPQPQPGEVLVGATEDGIRIAVQVDYLDTANGSEKARVLVRAVWRLGVPAPGHTIPTKFTERLRLDLSCLSTKGRVQLGELGFAPESDFSWSKLPDDQTLYEYPDETPLQLDEATASLYEKVRHPRFPLAYTDTKRPIAIAFPLGMPTVPDDNWRSNALGSLDPVAVAARDGLKDFCLKDVLDEHLRSHSVAALPAEAFHWRYQQNEVLTGMHALYFIPEVSLLSLPDATHPKWGEVPGGPTEPELPTAGFQPVKKESDHLSLAWNPSEEIKEDANIRWHVQISASPDFSLLLDEFCTDQFKTKRIPPPVCVHRLWFRVRAEQGERLGAWSNTVSHEETADGFQQAKSPAPLAPVLKLDNETGIKCSFAWKIEAPEGHSSPTPSGYELQEAPSPDFAQATTLYHGPNTRFELQRPNQERRFYRVRALFKDGQDPIGPWSLTVTRTPQAVSRWEVTEQADMSTLFDLHKAMLTMAAARADMCAVLSLPLGTEYPDVEAHRARLVTAFAATPNAASYALLYHPWPLMVGAEGTRALPPDGPVLAEFARRAITEGAWVAPANLPFVEALGLTAPAGQGGQSVEDSHWAALYAQGVNQLRQRPEGITVLSAETLAQDSELRPVNVRRLLILLRRLALREGDFLVFEPNNAAFQRRVAAHFEALLTDLFERGAFSGARAEQGFQVVVDESVNSPQSLDQGRFVVELRVAPSRPLAFLTVRLVQQGTNGLAVESP